MSTQANATRIGAFVIGAVLLLVACLLVFGSGRFFQKTGKFVAYFDGSVAGLRAGSAVNFRGVSIGSVTDVVVQYSFKNASARIPVYLEILPNRLQWVDEPAPEVQSKGELQKMIDAGLRAQLSAESLVTGQLAVELSFQPGTPVRLVATDTDVPELPTLPSDIEQLKAKLEALPLDQLAASAIRAIDNLNALIASPEAKELVPELLGVLQETKRLAATAGSEVQPLAASVKSAAVSAEDFLKEGQRSLARADSQLAPAVADLRRILQDLDAQLPPVLKRLSETLTNINTTLSPNSAMTKNLRRALADLSAAARSVRALADEIESNPSALIRGRQ